MEIININCTKTAFLLSIKCALMGYVKTVGDSFSNETEFINDIDIEEIAQEIIEWHKDQL